MSFLVRSSSAAILGLGAVGRATAKRAGDGFGMTVFCHNGNPVPDVPYQYCATRHELAEASDFLIVAVPGGEGTRGLIGHDELAHLRAGYLVNVGRGSVVDTPALVEALTTGGLAGAALDVFDNEPNVPAELLQLSNVVLPLTSPGGPPRLWKRQ